MAVKAPPPAPAPVTNWTGWYAGINFGGGWGTSNNATTTVTPLVDNLAQFFPGSSPSGSLAPANSGVAALNQSGPIGGFQFGYNWQFSPLIVVGFEADIQGAAITSDRAGNTGTSTESFAGSTTSTASANCVTTGLVCAATATGTSFFKTAVTANSAEVLVATFSNAAISASGFDSVTADVNWLGTVRGRLGYLITPNLLLYATGGLAYGGVSASDSLTTNFNLTADSFALAYSQAIGTPAAAQVAAISTPTAAVAAAAAETLHTNTTAVTTATLTTSTAAAAANCNLIPCTHTANFTPPGAPIATALATASRPTSGESTTSLAQSATKLSAALATSAQSFVHVSDTKFGGTIGGGIEWMMAQNWSVKAEALYYDLGSVTISTPLTASLNPLTAAIPATVGTASTAGVTSAINKFTGAATVSNVATTHVTFQGVIIRLGLNYHFNVL